MQDKYLVDGHKMAYHPGRVAQWLEAGDDWNKLKKIYPIYLEVSPVGYCNHRCVFCAVDYLDYRSVRLEASTMHDRYMEMGANGVKSIMFAGEGEPLLHKEIATMASSCHQAGIDISFTTNGVLAKEHFTEQILPITSWIKISCNAGTAETYGKIHRTNSADFDLVFANLRRMVKARENMAASPTLGVQLLLLPENAHEAEELAKRCADTGVDYLVIKPYSQHQYSKTRQYETIDYNPFLDLEERLNKLGSDSFSVIFRKNTMLRHDREKAYPSCMATPFFWAYVMSDGSLYTCSCFLGQEKFVIGNLHSNSFTEVWESEARKQNYLHLKNTLDISACRNNCRMDSINNYLWGLTNPPPHTNFI